MKETAGKIFGLIIFLFLIGSIIYLNFFGAKAETKDSYESISISGNSILTAEDYLHFAKYDDSLNLFNTTLQEVKIKMEQHPYIVKANVKYDGSNTIAVELIEKKLKAVVLSGNNPSLVTEDYKTVPLLKNASFTELPVISKLKTISDESGNSIPDNLELEQAYKIIDAIIFVDENIYAHLDEVNLRNGRDIVLSFSGLKSSVIFGRGNVAEKIVFFQALWNKMNSDKNLFIESEYIDLRYNSKIFVGKKLNTEATG